MCLGSQYFVLKSHTGETGRLIILSNNILLIILSNIRGQPGGTQSKVLGLQHTQGPRVLLGRGGGGGEGRNCRAHRQEAGGVRGG